MLYGWFAVSVGLRSFGVFWISCLLVSWLRVCVIWLLVSGGVCGSGGFGFARVLVLWFGWFWVV